MKKTGFRQGSLSGVLFTLPAITGFVALTLIPMIASFLFSLTDYSAFNVPRFIGFKNYIDIFSDSDLFFYKALMATTYFSLLNVPASIIFAFGLALFLNADIKYKSIFRTVFYIPSIVPAVAGAMIWLWMLNPDFGLVNSLLKTIGLPTSDWLFAEESVIPTIVMIGLWGTGGTMIIFLAGLQEIPKQYYEAIEVDGGNAFHKITAVTMPLMTPTIFLNTILALIGSFQIFTQAYILTNGGPNDASLFYVFYLFRVAFKNTQMGYASALAWILFIIVMGFSLVVIKSQKQWVYYEGDKR